MSEHKSVTTINLGGERFTVMRRIPVTGMSGTVRIPVPVINDPLRAQQGTLIIHMPFRHS